MTAPTKTESREEKILQAAACRRYILEIEGALKDGSDWRQWMFRLACAACDIVRAEEGDEPAERIWDALTSLGTDDYGWLKAEHLAGWLYRFQATFAQRSTQSHFVGTGLTITEAIANYIRDFDDLGAE